MPPMSAEEYRQRAEACDRLAETATSPHVRETMVYVASRWRALAEKLEAKDQRAKAQGIRQQRPSDSV